MIIICQLFFVQLALSINCVSTLETSDNNTPTPDCYENDDIRERANFIYINDKTNQHHTLHHKNDVDWVYFYAKKERRYTIEAINLGFNCNIVLDLYSSDPSEEPIHRNDRGCRNENNNGEEQIPGYKIPKDGFYFVKVSHYIPSAGSSIEDCYGINAYYELRVTKKEAGAPGHIKGIIYDKATNLPVSKVAVSSTSKTSELVFSNELGYYAFYNHESSDNLFTIKASKQNYADAVNDQVKVNENATTKLDFFIDLQAPETNLTVITEGNGRIESNPPGIDCGNQCSAFFEQNSQVTLIAYPDEGWIFDRWSSPCGKQKTCSVTITENLQQPIRAIFVKKELPSGIPLKKGWNIIGLDINKCFYIDQKPQLNIVLNLKYEKVADISEILQSIDGQYLEIHGFDQNGFSTYNRTQFSNMKYMAGGYGYIIKINENANVDLNGYVYLNIDAEPLDISTPIHLSNGWNLVSYIGNKTFYKNDFPQSPNIKSTTTCKIISKSIDDIFCSIKDQYKYIGEINYPETPTFIAPGRGYWLYIQSSQPAILRWDDSCYQDAVVCD